MARTWSFNRFRGYAPKIDKSVRSGFEGKIKNDLIKNGVSFQYESVRIPYTRTHTYCPDFILDNGVIVEAKGLFLAEDRTKHIEVKKQHPHLDIRFLFQKDQPLYKGAKSKYSDWCKRHSFKYAIGNKVPTEWIKEKGGK